MTVAMRDIAELVEKIASGDLRVAIEPQSEDDLLSNALAKMVENLRTSTADLAESISYLGSSASEILAATTQVASRNGRDSFGHQPDDGDRRGGPTSGATLLGKGEKRSLITRNASLRFPNPGKRRSRIRPRA